MGGGGGGGGEGEDERGVTQRQKEIIAATFNQIRDKGKDRASLAENSKFLSEVQSKLRDQSKSLAQRMRSRELSQQNAEFQSFAKDMEAAAVAMGDAGREAEEPEVAGRNFARAEGSPASAPRLRRRAARSR
jgi:hypothetical protein